MNEYCCEHMKESVEFSCTDCTDEFSCPDTLIYYSKKFDEYGIIVHDGGTSSMQIFYCPWCGKKLPDSKRDLWFGKLESMGFDDPSEQDIPSEFLDDRWFKQS